MDVQSHRKARLRELINKRCKGVIAVFADKIGRSESYVSRMLYPIDKAGAKPIADKMNLVIEEAFKLPRAWLDLPLGSGLDEESLTESGGPYRLGHANSSHVASEPGTSRLHPKWPFDRVSPQQYSTLSRKQKDHVEDTVYVLMGGNQEATEKSVGSTRRAAKV